MQRYENNYAFIDSQNLKRSIKELGWEVNFYKLYKYLQAKYRVTEAYLFIGYIPENKWLYTYLKKIGFKLVFKKIVRLSLNNTIKGNIDAELVLYSAKIKYHHYDKAIIISNDGDFYCLINELIKDNKLLKILTPSYKYSSLLKKFSDYIIPIPIIKNKIKK